MRSSDEITALILAIANSDDRIRAVLLNGSRANPTAKKDAFQDFDIVYLVQQINTFRSDVSWIDRFGERLILQMPDVMTPGNEVTDKQPNPAFSYLMLFNDGNRIDLTLFPVEALKNSRKQDSLTVVLLDKDHLYSGLPQATDTDYHIKCPAEKEFLDCCNEFWWVSTYVAKGLWRGEITYAKEMLELPVRTMFLKMIEWFIGINTRFSVPFGKGGRFMKDHLPASIYQRILSTYPDAQVANMWPALFTMTAVFRELAMHIAAVMNFRYNKEEDEGVTAYLKRVYALWEEKARKT